MAATLQGAQIRIVEQYDFTIVSCSVCGTPIALDVDFKVHRQRDHKTFYCPNGHNQYFPSESEEERLRRLLQRRDADLNGALDKLASVERKAKRAEGQLKKVKTRVHNGVCPECNRTFVRLAYHMRSKHGTPEEEAAVIAEHKADAS